MGAYNSNVAIQSIVFHPDGGFDLTYAEPENIHPKGWTLCQHTCPAGVVDTTAVIDEIRELLDKALDARLETPDTITRQR